MADSTTEEVTIQEAARRTGLGEHTLRYYERLGLIAPVRRGATSGHRRYTAADLDWIAFLGRLRTLGMPVAQMQEYAALRAAGPHTARARRALLESHRRAVSARVDELCRCLAVIEGKIALYERMEAEDDDAGDDDAEPGRGGDRPRAL
jgi:DNA-binding transcriptional MerR regulator